MPRISKCDNKNKKTQKKYKSRPSPAFPANDCKNKTKSSGKQVVAAKGNIEVATGTADYICRECFSFSLIFYDFPGLTSEVRFYTRKLSL